MLSFRIEQFSIHLSTEFRFVNKHAMFSLNSTFFPGYGVVTIGFSRPKGRLIDLVKNLSSRSLNTKSLSKKKRTEKCQEKKVNANKQTLLSLSFSFLKYLWHWRWWFWRILKCFVAPLIYNTVTIVITTGATLKFYSTTHESRYILKSRIYIRKRNCCSDLVCMRRMRRIKWSSSVYVYKCVTNQWRKSV